jgi:hypothetical protein
LLKMSVIQGTEGSVPDDFSIPASGIEQVDRALFNLFNETIPFQVKIEGQSSKVPVVFSTGERFALTRRSSPIRDRNNALILPLISIHRTAIDISPGQSGYGTPISFRPQEMYVVRKRLSKKDRKYQRLINKLGLKNQDDAASRKNFARNDIFPGNDAKAGTVASRRNDRNLTYHDDPTGTLLRNNIGNNIFEIITVPYPKFMTLSYTVTFWTQYQQDMNELVEVLLSKFTGQDYAYQIQSKNGHKYVAYLKQSLSTDDNFSDFSSDERVIKYSFNMAVPAYMLAPQHAGLETPFRRFLSAPQIEFTYTQTSAQVVKSKENPDAVIDQDKFILSDVQNQNTGGRVDGSRSDTGERIVETVQDPFTGKEVKRLVPVVLRNQRSGETVSKARVTVKLETTFDTPTD